MSPLVSQLQQCLCSERDAHRRQVELVRASLVLRPAPAAPAGQDGGRRA